MYMVYIWLAVIALGLLLELVDAGTLVTIWFSVGAIIPLGMSFFGYTEPWFVILEFIIFGIVTILCLVYLRKISKKVLFKNNKEKTNTDLYIGKKYKVHRVEGELDYIKINGVEYRAVCEEDVQLGDIVEAIKISGNKVIVNKVEKKENKEEK